MRTAQKQAAIVGVALAIALLSACQGRTACLDLATTGEELDLSGADLSTCELVGADLAGANLRDADLTAANLAHANLFGADLRGARFLNASLHAAEMTGAIIDSETDFTIANLEAVDLSR